MITYDGAFVYDTSIDNIWLTITALSSRVAYSSLIMKGRGSDPKRVWPGFTPALLVFPYPEKDVLGCFEDKDGKRYPDT